jgi:hypothetical protein
MVPSLTNTLLELVERTISWTERRLLIVTKGAKQHFLASMIVALVRARLWPEQADAVKQKIIEHIGTLATSLMTRHEALTEHLDHPGRNNDDTAMVMKVSGVVSDESVSRSLRSLLSK